MKPATLRDADAEHGWAAFFAGLQTLMTHEAAAPVRGLRDPDRLATDLALEIGESGVPLAQIVAELVQIAKATPVTSSSQFFNQLFGGRIEAATIAEMFAAFLNNSMYTYKVAGPQVLIERMLIDRMCAFAGFEAGDGSFTPGGSMSNMLAMIVAREVHFPEQDDGRPPTRHGIAYTSDLGHYSVRKNTMLTGVGRRNLRKVATTADGRMDPQALSAQIEADLAAGYQPFFLNITAGTTVLGAFDPIAELTAVARQSGLWVHVDGALGGSMLLSKAHRHLLTGLEHVDSFTWDAHKIMGVPLTSSVCLFREAGLLEAHLVEPADYLFQDNTPTLDPGRSSMQCGRRNDALKLWAAWKSLGDEGYAARIENLVAMAAYVARKIDETPGLTLVKQPVSVNVVFSVDGVDAPTMCKALHASERAMVGFAKVDGARVIRLAVSAPTTPAVLDAFVASVMQTAGEVLAR